MEGKGDAVITDVIYSSKTTSEEAESSTGSKKEYEALKVDHKYHLSHNIIALHACKCASHVLLEPSSNNYMRL